MHKIEQKILPFCTFILDAVVPPLLKWKHLWKSSLVWLGDLLLHCFQFILWKQNNDLRAQYWISGEARSSREQDLKNTVAEIRFFKNNCWSVWGMWQGRLLWCSIPLFILLSWSSKPIYIRYQFHLLYIQSSHAELMSQLYELWPHLLFITFNPSPPPSCTNDTSRIYAPTE
jgi:hypothetical protein